MDVTRGGGVLRPTKYASNTDIFLIFLVTFMSIVEGKFVAHKKNNNFDTVHSVSVKIKNVQKINDYGAYFRHC